MTDFGGDGGAVYRGLLQFIFGEECLWQAALAARCWPDGSHRSSITLAEPTVGQCGTIRLLARVGLFG